jgi:tetratricopeptide (TPR) repeat protein
MNSGSIFERARLQAVPPLSQINVGFSRWGTLDLKLTHHSALSWIRRLEFMSDTAEDLLQQAQRARREHRLEDAKRDLVAAVALRRKAGGQDLARALTALGQIERDQRQNDAALQHHEEAVTIYRAAGEPLKLAHTIRHVADILRETERAKLAEPRYDEALALYRHHPETPPLDLANAIRGLALLKSDTGETEAARTLWEEARELYAAVNVEAGVTESNRRLALLTKDEV